MKENKDAQNILDLHRDGIPTELIDDSILKDGFDIFNFFKCEKCKEKIIGIKYRKEVKLNNKNKPVYSHKERWLTNSNHFYHLCFDCNILREKENKEFYVKDSIKNFYKRNFLIKEKIKKIKNQKFQINDIHINNVIGLILLQEWIIVIQFENNDRIKHFFPKDKIDNGFSSNAPIQNNYISFFDENIQEYITEPREDNELSEFSEEEKYGTKEIYEEILENSNVYKNYYKEFPDFFNENLYNLKDVTL